VLLSSPGQKRPASFLSASKNGYTSLILKAPRP
jgi:hypothetical protein